MRRIRHVADTLSSGVASVIERLDLITRRWWRVGVAAALIVVPLVLGIVTLSQASPVRAEPVSVGFVPPVAGKPARGFAIGLVARMKSCSEPLDVTVVAAGTGEYWIDNAQRLKGPATFQLALPDVVDGKVDLRTGTTATDVVDPDTTSLRRDDTPLVAPGHFHQRSPRQDGELTIVGATIDNWQATLVPIVADFKADWTEERGLGTCFVHLPAVAGDLSILSAQRALGNAREVGTLIVEPNELTVDSRRHGISARYDPGLEVTYGTATVRVENGSIDSDESIPPPTASVNGNPAWTCSGRARSTKLLAGSKPGRARDGDNYVLIGPDPLGSAGALSIAALRAGPAGDCSAVVAAVEGSAPWKRDLVLLLIGAIVSLGITILVEFALRVRSRSDTGTETSLASDSSALHEDD